MDLELVGAILERVLLAEDVARQLARLAGRHEAGTEAIGDGSAHEEATGLGADDLGDASLEEVVGDLIDGSGKALRACEQRRDVLEDDARLRIVGDVNDIALEIDARHG